MVGLKVVASPETGDTRTAVREYEEMKVFNIPVDPDTVRWKSFRKFIERETFSSYGDGYRRWVWGLHAMCGRKEKFVLYDCWYQSNMKKLPADRAGFIKEMAKGNKENLYIKAKWSWPRNGCAHVHMWESDIDDTAIEPDAMQDIPAFAANGNAELSRAPLRALLRSRVDGQRQSVYVLECNRISREFERRLLMCAELDDCRKRLEEEHFDVRLPRGVKVFVPPDMYDFVMAALEDYERVHGALQSRHVVVSDEFLLQVRALVSGVPKVLLKSETVLVDREELFYQEDRTFIRIPDAAPSMFSKPSTEPYSAPARLQGR